MAAIEDWGGPNDQEWFDPQERGEDSGERPYSEGRHNPRKPTFPIPYGGGGNQDPRKRPFDIPYAGKPGRRAGFGSGNESIRRKLTGGGRYSDLDERGEDQGNRPVWERDRSLRAGFQFGDGSRQQDGIHRGKGPKNYQRSDQRISEDINDRLAEDEFVDASDVEVTVRSCEVTLSGTVESRDEKRRAEDIAESVTGVKNVENRIRVQRNTDWVNRDGNSEDRTIGTTRSNVSETMK